MRFDIPNSERETPRSTTTQSTEHQGRYKLDRFPRQLKKRFYDTTEPRFLLILLSSLFLHAVVALYLSEHVPTKDKTVITQKVRDRFTKLLLEDDKDFGSAPIARSEEADTERLTDYELLESLFADLEEGSPRVDDLLDLPGPDEPETSLPSARKREADRRLRSQRRQQALDALSRDVERIGLLGVLTTNTGNFGLAQVMDILNFADSTATDLEKSLAFLKGLRVPRRDNPLMYASYERSDFSRFEREALSEPKPIVKGKRIKSDVKVDEVVEELADVKQVPVEKRKDFERVPSSFSLSNLNDRAGNGHAPRLKRDPKKVREVVLSHYSAIQDCYNQELKNDAELKGKVVVRFVISPEGHVIHASIVSSTIPAQEMLDCLLSRILKWNDFSPVHPSSGNMAIKQTYVFGF